MLPDLGAMAAIVHGRFPEVAGARFHVAADEPEEAVARALGTFRAAAGRAHIALGAIEAWRP